MFLCATPQAKFAMFIGNALKGMLCWGNLTALPWFSNRVCIRNSIQAFVSDKWSFELSFTKTCT